MSSTLHSVQAYNNDSIGSFLLWLMTNLNRAMTNKLFLPKNYEIIYNTCELWPHRSNVSSWTRGAEVRDRDFEKRVSRNVSRHPLLLF